MEQNPSDISQCNRCGFCQTACPIFRSTGHESGVARGRLSLLRAIDEGRLEWSRELEEPIFNCLLCGACTANCFPAIPTSDYVIQARAKYLEKVGRKPIHHLLFETLLPYPKRLRLAARSAALGKKAGLSAVVQALGMLKIFGQESIYADSMLELLGTPPFRDTVETGEYAGTGDTLTIGYFVGCGADILNQNGAAATFQTLKTIGKRVHVMDNSCCGLPAHVYGDLAAARMMAARNLDIIDKETFDIIVTDCSSCASFLKKYPALFEADPRRRKLAEKVSGQVKDMVEVLAAAPLPAPTEEDGVTVTYHDPCHASRGQGLVAQPRDLLRTLPGITFEEMPEADWCCGGAGSYALSHQSLSQKVLDRKIENFKKTKADILVTSCPACIIHLSYGMRRHGLNAKVCHISEMVGKNNA